MSNPNNGNHCNRDMSERDRRAHLLAEIHDAVAICAAYGLARTASAATLLTLWRRGLPYTDLTSDSGDRSQALPPGRILAVAWQEGDDCDVGQLRYASPQSLDGNDLDTLAQLAASLIYAGTWLASQEHMWGSQFAAIAHGDTVAWVEYSPETNEVMLLRTCPLGDYDEDEQETTVSSDDETTRNPAYERLHRLYFRAGQRGAVNVIDATPEEFDEWARNIAHSIGASSYPFPAFPPSAVAAAWPLAERAAFVAWAEARGITFAYTTV